MNGRDEAEQMAAEHEAANPPPRVTDAELEALDYFAVQASAYGATDFAAWARHAATLRSLLARLG